LKKPRDNSNPIRYTRNLKDGIHYFTPYYNEEKNNLDVTLPSKLVEFIASCDSPCISIDLHDRTLRLNINHDELCLELSFDNLTNESFLHELKLKVSALMESEYVCFIDLLNDDHVFLKYLVENEVLNGNHHP
jgi:hypothetical protein